MLGRIDHVCTSERILKEELSELELLKVGDEKGISLGNVLTWE